MPYEINIAARKLAEELLSLVPALLADNDEHAQRFWELIAKHAAAQLPKKPPGPNALMNHEEAMTFADEVVPFRSGQYVGFKVRDVPAGYWIATTQSEFNRRLVRYLKSEYFKGLQGEPWDSEDESDEVDK